jgi:hypothetical protein
MPQTGQVIGMICRIWAAPIALTRDGHMIRRYPRESSLEKELSDLLTKLCVEWGFCIPPKDFDRIAASQRLDVAEFATEVLLAEGLNPEYELHWFREIKRRFVDHFGRESVLAEDYLSGEE